MNSERSGQHYGEHQEHERGNPEKLKLHILKGGATNLYNFVHLILVMLPKLI